MRQLNQTLGYYLPALFKLYINTDKPIDLNKVSAPQSATFVHEYTHFIQDFTTLKGLQNIFNTYEWLRFFVTTTSVSGKVSLPFNISHDVLALNAGVATISWGTRQNIPEITSFNKAKVNPVSVPAEILKKYPQLGTFNYITVEARLPDGSTVPIEIGTLAVMESMAHLAEGLMGLPVTKSPDYPYNAVRLLADHLCPAAKLSDEVLFAVCDIALQSTTPGVAVYNILKDYGNGCRPLPADGHEVYRQFPLAFGEWHSVDQQSLPNMAFEHLHELVKPPMGLRYQAWIDRLQSLAMDLRRNNLAFMIDQFRAKNRYADIVNNIGTPLMVNDVEQYAKVPAKLPGSFPVTMDVEFFPALDYILNLYFSGAIECPMQHFCKDSKVPVDKCCISDPLLRANPALYRDFCPVGALWHSWAMKEYHINGASISKI